MATVNHGRSLPSIIQRAHAARLTGRWPGWRHHPMPNGVPGSRGWAAEFRRCSENGVFAVLIRDVETPWGMVRHAMISSPADGVEPSWAEKQRIKNELLGRERVAVEVFPGMSQLIDQANAYHLWCLPPEMALPFGLHAQRPETGDRLPGSDAGEVPAHAGGISCTPLSPV